MTQPLGVRCGRVAIIAALAALVAATLWASPAAARSHRVVAGACPSSSPRVQSITAAQPSGCWHPFSDGSPFNTPLPANPRPADDNAAVTNLMVSRHWVLNDVSDGFVLPPGGSRPIYFARPSNPMMTIRCTDETGPGTCQSSNGVDIDGARIHVPAGARPDPNWDSHMTIIETATGVEYDLWHASVHGSTITAGTGGMVDVNGSNGIGNEGDAAHFALTAGLLRPAELASGTIDHALVITVPCTNANGPDVGFTWPAQGGWGTTCGQFGQSSDNAPSLGQLVALDMTPQQIANSGAPGWEQTIMTALARYGAYIEDTNGSSNPHGMMIITQSSESWTAMHKPDPWLAFARSHDGYHGALESHVPIPTSRLELINTCVTRGTCQNGGQSGNTKRARSHKSKRGRSHKSKRGRSHTSKRAGSHTSKRHHAHARRR